MKKIIIHITDTNYGAEELKERTMTVEDLINALKQYGGDIPGDTPVLAVIPNWTTTYGSISIEEDDEDDDWED